MVLHSFAHTLFRLYQVLEKTPVHLVINMVELLQTFEATPRYLDTGIDLFCALNDHHFMDLLGNFSIQQVSLTALTASSRLGDPGVAST